MANALARYLPCFDTDPAPSPFVFATPSPVEAPVEAVAVDLVAEAEERGRVAGFQAASATFEAMRAEDASRHQRDLAEARQDWSETEAERLAGQFRLAFQDMEAAVTAEVAQILSGFVAAAVAAQAVAELADTLSNLLAEGHGAVQVSGPEDLLAALRGRLGAGAASLAFIPDAKPDVRIVLGATVLETQLQAWRDRLMAAAG